MESNKKDPVSSEILLEQQEKKNSVNVFIPQVQFVMLFSLLHVRVTVHKQKEDGRWNQQPKKMFWDS